MEEKKQNIPKLASDGAGARNGRRTRNGTYDSSNGKGTPKSGEKIPIRIVAPAPGGYTVVLLSGEAGYIKTPLKFEEGEETVGQFVCIHNGKYLLSPIFSGVSDHSYNDLKDFHMIVLASDIQADKEP